MGKEKLANVQRKQLKEILAYAYENVPFYHRAFDSAGVSPTDVDEPGAIRKVPRVERAQFRKVPLQDRTSTNLAPETCQRITTSGTTGTPVKFLLDSYAAAWR